MATDAETLRPAAKIREVATVRLPRWSPAACAAAGVGALFIAATCWWLSLDRSVPVDDAGFHLEASLKAYEAIGGGHLLRALTGASPYPPLIFLVGALGTLVGGVGVDPPIVAQNLVFVSLLALGCYQVGRLAFGRLAGLLAVVFALGSPMMIEEFHEFMLDAPEAAMVAVALWALLATDGFTRRRACAVAGALAGLGLLSKEPFVFFLAGPALVMAVRGGRAAWRGMAVFAGVAFVIAAPWYLYELSKLHELGAQAFGSSASVAVSIPGIAPPRFSSANLEWYFWSFANWDFFAPLLAFTAVGAAWMLAGLLRRRPAGRFSAELLVGASCAWVALTFTYVHDPRYGIPITVYFAVIAAGWVSRLPLAARVAGATLLGAVALANVLGIGFGLGGRVTTAPQNLAYVQQPGAFTVYANYGYWIGAPSRDGDTLGLLRALRRDGVREVRWYTEGETGIEFSPPGVSVLARIAGLGVAANSLDPAAASPQVAFLLHRFPEASLPRPCIELRDGSGVWVGLGGSPSLKSWSGCPRAAG
jgi:4-amino-4-deoxy-L-arabinose transferase-like glycosyltransferase